MRLTQLSGTGPELYELYHEILEPSFPAAVLGGVSSLESLARSDSGSIWLSVADDGQVLAGAIGEWDAPSRVMLLAWMAVRPGNRGGGIGGPLLCAALAAWRAEHDPCLILAEVADPARHQRERRETAGGEDGSGEAYGDPEARLRFYQRRGARVLDLPYYQPGLGARGERVRDLLLLVLHAHPQFDGVAPDTIDPGVIRGFLETYHAKCEGTIGRDAEATRLWTALQRPQGITFR
ncbi:hypothetical protein [Longispora albida]|uniref:hypothetical protein n=1 Tax=Longispora albida TaxID=203523 RepID=UPI00037AE7B7|nr:hypothetical protein [Longispora albida]